MVHPELGIRLLTKVANDLKGVAQLDGQPIHEGRIMSLILSPISAKQVVVKDSKDGKDSKDSKDSKEIKEAKEIKVKETV
jgi:translation initiation factor IF-3